MGAELIWIKLPDLTPGSLTRIALYWNFVETLKFSFARSVKLFRNKVKHCLSKFYNYPRHLILFWGKHCWNVSTHAKSKELTAHHDAGDAEGGHDLDFNTTAPLPELPHFWLLQTFPPGFVSSTQSQASEPEMALLQVARSSCLLPAPAWTGAGLYYWREAGPPVKTGWTTLEEAEPTPALLLLHHTQFYPACNITNAQNKRKQTNISAQR